MDQITLQHCSIDKYSIIIYHI